jgi:mercuric ion binding protein
MRHLKLSTGSLVIILVTLFSITSSFAQEKKTNGKAVIKTTLNCDHCKECETCGLKFKTEMLKINGVKMYTLDDKAMAFTVYFNPKKTELETIKVAISKLGYDADDIKADPSSFEKLDNCCKGLE